MHGQTTPHRPPTTNHQGPDSSPRIAVRMVQALSLALGNGMIILFPPCLDLIIICDATDSFRLR